MLSSKPSKLSVCAGVCLLSISAAGAAQAPTHVAAERSGGVVIDLGSLPGAASNAALDINDAGAAAGQSMVGADGHGFPTERNGRSVITLDGPPGWPGWMGNAAFVINSAREAFGASNGHSTAAPSASGPTMPVPELSIWAMMFLGFAGLRFAAVGRRSAGARSFPPD